MWFYIIIFENSICRPFWFQGDSINYINPPERHNVKIYITKANQYLN